MEIHATLPYTNESQLLPMKPAADGTPRPPTPEEIDAAIVEYESALRLVKAAQETADGVKTMLLYLVETHGQVPANAEQSKRLVGRHNEATITWSTSFNVIEDGVRDLRAYLIDERLGDLFVRFFSLQLKHKMVDGARDVLKTLDLPKRVAEKIASLVGLAIDVKTSAPSLKVKMIQPEKPARKPRGGKAGA